MNTNNAILLMALLYLASCPYSESGAIAADPVTNYLVRGRVKSIKEAVSGGISEATVEIVHVYSGPKDLMGRSFLDYSGLGSWRQDLAPFPFSVEEEGVWGLIEREGKLQIKRFPIMPFRYRSRKADNPRHAAVVAVADMVEKWEKEKAEARVTLLKVGAMSDTPEVSGWAVQMLGAVDSAEAREYLDVQMKTPEKLPLAGQVALDVVLADRNGAVWLGAEARLTMLRGWVNEMRTEYEVRLVYSRIGLAHQREEISDKLALELYRTAAENTRWPWLTRRAAFGPFGETARRAASDEAKAAAYEWLFDRVRADKDIEVRRVAATTIQVYMPLYPKRLKAIEEHLTTEKDEKVATALREAVQRAKERDNK